MTGESVTGQLFAFAKREVKARIAYRMTIVTSTVSVLTGLLAYGLLGRTSIVSVTTSTYGMTLASFLVSGVAFAPLITNGLGMFGNYIYPGQIEEIMTMPTSFRRYLLLSSALPISISVGSAALSFTVGVFLFGLAFSYNFPALIAVVVLGVVTSIALGFLGVAFQLVYKQTSVLSWLLYAFTGVAGNMLVPTQVLPQVVQDISFLTPQYYFFTGIRIALGSELAPLLLMLGIFAAYAGILIALALFSLERALRFLRRNGTHGWA